MLPQFGAAEKIDINDYFSLNKTADKNQYQVVFESNPNNKPKELDNLIRELDDKDQIPVTLRGPK